MAEFVDNKNTTKHTHTFGPVPSRRLGRSLGIDVVPYKFCSYDCIYCQLGRTTCKSIKREAFFPVDNILSEVETRLSQEAQFHYLTLSGSGEPTLFSGIGKLIRRLKTISSVPVALLTNGSLLFQRELGDSLLDLDLVAPSLDAGNESAFRKMNRPHRALNFCAMVEGLIEFRRRFRGKFFLEIFLLDGVNDSEKELDDLKKWTERIHADRIQLNTAVRPTTVGTVRPLDDERMKEIARFFGPSCEVIADYGEILEDANFEATRQMVLELLSRRPCTLEDIAAGLQMHITEATKYIQELTELKMIGETLVHKRRMYNALSSKTEETCARYSNKGGNSINGR